MPGVWRLAGAVAIAVIAGTCAAKADTVSYADAITVLAKDCGSDIKKLCKGLNLGNNRIADCLAQNSAKVSPTCTSTLASVAASIQKREQAQTSYKQVCATDMARRCNGVKGDGYILACLAGKTKTISKQCSQTITDAGWR
ncbi:MULTISPECIES: hypothetical protein [unclassified Rhizobium]|jgi:hypothetical protein|uniref:hypothetical protein n=1 Tax=unclassified Rhizobium TaxID=2613769 RepID=UPI000DD73993|nr:MULTISPECIES: hypothetical protein [unclassified Rhizobium]MBB3440753.1 hypothetical protein [Rhizobium sp. BK379]MBB3560338.1 hypothetical protein [Rhizobium sp. BK512]